MKNETIHPAALPIDQLLAECEIRRGKRSGPGGQHRNKVETAIMIRHLPSGVKSEATERRSQEQNRKQAVFRLRLNLALEQRAAVNIKSNPSELWRSRLSSGRLAISTRHDDFPAVLAEALDVIVFYGADVKSAAVSLRCTTSQLTKLIKSEPRAMQLINQRRRDNDLPALR